MSQGPGGGKAGAETRRSQGGDRRGTGAAEPAPPRQDWCQVPLAPLAGRGRGPAGPGPAAPAPAVSWSRNRHKDFGVRSACDPGFAACPAQPALPGEAGPFPSSGADSPGLLSSIAAVRPPTESPCVAGALHRDQNPSDPSPQWTLCQTQASEHLQARDLGRGPHGLAWQLLDRSCLSRTRRRWQPVLLCPLSAWCLQSVFAKYLLNG